MEQEFIRHVTAVIRDRAISDCEVLLAPGAVSPKGKEWSQILETSSSPADLVRRVCPDIVDLAVSFLLREIDGGKFSISVHDDETGEVKYSPEPGELTGDYLGTVDW